MKVLETTLSIGRTINLGNYESLRVDLSIRSQLDSEETYESDVKEMEETLKKSLASVVERQISHIRGGKEKFI
jgi:hypothetical protein